MNQIPPVVVGVDVGGTKILVGYVGRDGTVFRSQGYPMDRTDQASTLSSIRSAVDAFYAREWSGPAPLAMGVGLVGHTDPARGIWVRAMNVPIQTPVSLAEEFQARYGLPVSLDNDVHAATMAELQLGAGQNTGDFVYLNVGTGIACGLVCNGQLVRGAGNYAGELGHMVVEPDGELCPQCGRRGCLEPIASGGGILARVRARLADYPTSVLREPNESGRLTVGVVLQAAAAGDGLASQVTERALQALEVALVNLLNLLNPELIVVGGGVFRDGWGIERLRNHIATNALSAAVTSFKGVVPSRMGPAQVGLLGAATLAWNSLAESGSVSLFDAASGRATK
jgi:glucokinase